MYERYCKRQDLRFEMLEEKGDGSQNMRSATFKVSGSGAGALAGEGGAHRIQHKTRSRKQDRIHTSTATVAVLPVAERGASELTRGSIKVEPFRASGPGGQHRNKADTAIRATHLSSGETAVIDGRSQHRNREAAVELLEARVAEAERDASERDRQSLRSRQTMADRAHAVRTYDEIRDVIRCENGKKLAGVQRVLNGRLDKLFA